MVDPYAIVRRLTGHELISPKDARLLTEAVDGLINEIGSKDARIAELEAENERLKKALSEQIDRDISGIFPGERALAERAGGVRAEDALRELANVKMDLSLEDWCRISNTILAALTTEPAAPEANEAGRIGDAVLDWMVKFDLLDAGNEYYVSDVLAVLNDLTLPTRPSEQAVTARKFALGNRVTKIKGSSWTGRVVGFYSTTLTPIGYAIESETETGSVQIYPEAALKTAMEAGRHD